MESTINVTRSSMPEYEEFCREIKSIWECRRLTNTGDKHKALQAELERYLGVRHVTLFTNGHLALENMLQALDKKGGEIITTPFTFASTTNAIVRSGYKPVFCDINPYDFTIDTAKIESLITDNTVAILPVHVYGNLCDDDAIEAIAKKHNLKVFYDAAHAFGVFKGEKSAAAMGDTAMFSFHATKVFNTIEGGALCYEDDELVDKFDRLKNFGIQSEESVAYVGGNAKLNEFCAAMGVCNMRHVDGWIAQRKVAKERYDQRLQNVPGIQINALQQGVRPNYAYYPVVFDGYGYNRDQIFDLLAEHNIMARKYFYPLTNSFDCYKGMDGFDPASTPVAEHVAENVLTLPMYADLSVEDVDRICDIILSVR